MYGSVQIAHGPVQVANGSVQITNEPAQIGIGSVQVATGLEHIVSCSVAEIRAVILALSVHGLHGPTQFRDRIVESYGVALQNHPRVAGQIVNDLAEWNLRAHSKQIATIIKNSKFAFDEVETEAIKSYLGSVGVADSR